MKKLIEHLKLEWYKYFLEILVLIIGIYGAFALEEWKENRSNHKNEVSILEKLYSNLQSDTANFNLMLRIVDVRRADTHTIISEMNNDELEDFSVSVAGTMITTFPIALSKSAWNTMLASDKILSEFSNKEIIDSLNNYYNLFDVHTQNWINANNEYTRNVVGPYLFAFDRMGLGSGSVPDSVLSQLDLPGKRPAAYRRDVKVLNFIEFRLETLGSIERRYLLDRARAENLLTMIRNELDRK